MIKQRNKASLGESDASFNGTFYRVHAPPDGVVLPRNTAIDQG
jgi:hypothetical protein